MKGFTPFTQIKLIEDKPYLPHTEEEFRSTYELPSDFKRNKFKDMFQFGEKGLLGEKYKIKKQDAKDGYRTQESIESSDFRDWDKKDDARDEEEYFDPKNSIAISYKDYNWREKDKNKKLYYPYHTGGKYDKDYTTIGDNNKGGKKRVIYRTKKENIEKNRYFQQAKNNRDLEREMLRERRKSERELPIHLRPETYNWNE